MAENVGGIFYTVDAKTDGLEKATAAANRELDKLAAGFKKSDTGADKLGRSVKAANAEMVAAQSGASGLASKLKGLVTAAAALATLKKLVDVQREFDRLNAGLITATGSAERAGVAFKALQDFAANTPYSLAQAVDGFTKLVNLGLTPSEAALTSYGNTAAAMGKDLSRMIEAVADASTGEFERLKEFGIKAASEGDRVSLTFRGVTTNIGKNAAEIEAYLISLGQNEFAGAMANRMATLDGAISNLGDSWDALFLNIQGSGLATLMEEGVRAVTAALDELSAQLASGQLEANFAAVAGQFDGLGRDIESTLQSITSLFNDESGRWSEGAASSVDTMLGAFARLPILVRSFIQEMVVTFASGFDRLGAVAASFKDTVVAVFTDSTIQQAANTYAQRLKVIDEARAGSMAEIEAERDAALASFDAQIAKAKDLRRQYDETNAARRASGGDRLAQFKADVPAGVATPAGSAAGSAADRKAADKAAKEAERQAKAAAKAEAKAKADAERQAMEQQNLLGQADPIAGEQQKYALELENLRKLNEAKLIEDQRYLDLKAQATTAHDEQMALLQEENFRRQSTGNELLMASLDQLQQGAADALVGLVTGASNGEDAVRSLASAILNEAVGALVKMGIEQVKAIVMGQTAQAGAAATAAASGAAMTAAYAPAAAAASVASFGGAAAAGLSALASTIPAAIAMFAGGRQYGGPVDAGGMYRINETGAPEVFQSANGRQYMLPNTRGEVISNADATQGGAGAGVSVYVTLNESQQQAGQVQQRTEGDTTFIDIFVADIMSDGKSSRAISSKFGLRSVGK